MAKTKTGKMPKRIGGVKLPKDLRRGLSALAAAASSPAGQEAIAAALTMAAAAITAQARRRRAAATPRDPTLSEHAPPVSASAAAPLDPHEIGVELGRIAQAALGGLFRPGGHQSPKS